MTRLRLDQDGDILVGRLSGDIDDAHAAELREALAVRLTNRSRGLVLDLSEVSYLDSAGIEFLFDVARRMRTHRQALRLAVPAEAPLRRVLALCSIDKVIGLDATADAAIAVIRNGHAH